MQSYNMIGEFDSYPKFGMFFCVILELFYFYNIFGTISSVNILSYFFYFKKFMILGVPAKAGDDFLENLKNPGRMISLPQPYKPPILDQNTLFILSPENV